MTVAVVLALLLGVLTLGWPVLATFFAWAFLPAMALLLILPLCARARG